MHDQRLIRCRKISVLRLVTAVEGDLLGVRADPSVCFPQSALARSLLGDQLPEARRRQAQNLTRHSDDDDSQQWTLKVRIFFLISLLISFFLNAHET